MQGAEDLFDGVPQVPLYHYTGISSLLGIAKEKVLWASSPYYLNDSAEVSYAASVLDKLVGERMARNQENEVSMRVLQELKKNIQFMRNPSHSVFTFSLSEEKSLLSQWRSYTPHGKGISIGFSRELIAKISASSNLKVARCLYKEHDQVILLDRLVEKVVAAAGQHIERFRDAAGEMPHPVYQFLGSFQSEILQALCVVKHPSFEEEREWRLIAVNNFGYGGQGLNFREGSSMLVPYIEIPLPDEVPVFSEVMLGPSQHSNLSMSALGDLLAKSGLCHSVGDCLIPYREW